MSAPATRRLLGAGLLLAGLLGIWELYVDLGGENALILPAPHAVAQAIVDDRALLWTNFLVTAEEVLLGVAVSVLGGLVLTVLIHFSPAARTAVLPLLVASQTVPLPMIVPLLVLWLGFGIGTKVAVIGLIAFFSVVIATLDALESVDPELVKLMRTFDAPRRRTFRLVEFPAALPGLFTGARIAVTVAVIGAVFAELSGANSGLGYVYQVSENQLLAPRAYATVVVLSAFAISLFVLINLLQRWALPWSRRPERSAL